MTTTLLDRIRANNRETLAIQSQLDRIEAYYDTPYTIMWEYYRAMKQKSAEKFIEGWVAYQTGTKKKDSVSYDRRNDQEGLDLGDLVAGTALVPGKNNIELKVMFSDGHSIGGGQLRFYEPLAGYLFMKAWTNTRVEYFYLTKDQLVEEIRLRARTAYKVDRQGQPKFYEAIGSSQGSGKIKGDTESRLAILDQNLAQERQDQIGWSFNSKTEPLLYARWQQLYSKTPEELRVLFAQIAQLAQ